jgi:hypothetical protein
VAVGSRAAGQAYLERPADGLVRLGAGGQVDAQLNGGHGQAIGELEGDDAVSAGDDVRQMEGDAPLCGKPMKRSC